jgi:hypothetical protein
MDPQIAAAGIAGVCSIVVALVSLFKRQSTTEQRVLEQREDLKAVSELQVLLAAIVTGAEARHLNLLHRGARDVYANHRGLRDELRSLIGRGLITKINPGLVHELPNRFELCTEFEITHLGRLLLDLRGRHSISDAIATGEEGAQAA